MASIQAKSGKKGKKTYYVVVSYHGKHKWLKAGSLKDARILRKQIESMEESRRLEKLGLSATDKRIDDFLQEYTDHVRLRTSVNTLKRYRSILNTFLVFLKMFHPNTKCLSQIKADHIESYQQQRLQSLELKTAADGEKPGNHKPKRLPLPQTVNFEVGVLGSAFIWAHGRQLIPSVPTRKVRPLKSKPHRQARILDPQECKLFLKTAREMSRKDRRLRPYSRAFQFLLNTGLRSGELCNLTWADIDMQTDLIKIQLKEGWTPKSYSREFFLNRASVKVLESLETDGYVFVDQTGTQLDSDSLRKVLIKIAKASGLHDLTRVHDLRHTFSSLMQKQGVDRGTVAAILGHKDLSTTLVYTHQTRDHMRKSINAINLR